MPLSKGGGVGGARGGGLPPPEDHSGHDHSGHDHSGTETAGQDPGGGAGDVQLSEMAMAMGHDMETVRMGVPCRHQMGPEGAWRHPEAPACRKIVWYVWGDVPVSYMSEDAFVEWHPVPGPYAACRGKGASAYFYLAFSGLLLASPAGFACAARGNHRRALHLKLLGVALGWLAAIVGAASQGGLASRAECRDTGAGHMSPHGSYALALLLGLTVEVLFHAWLVARGQVVSLPGLPHPGCKSPSASGRWVFVGRQVRRLANFVTGDVHLQRGTWSMVVAIAFILAGFLSFTWYSLGCYEYSHFTAQELGHLSYAIMWTGVTCSGLAFNHPRARIHFSKMEGRLMLGLGFLSVCIVTLGSNGGIFWGTNTGRAFMKDLQHTSTAGVWMVSGLLQVVCARLQIVTGLPYFLATTFHCMMIYLHGHQANALSVLLHKVHGACVALCGVMRLADRPLETALFGTLGAVLFMAGSDCPCSWANHVNLNIVGYLALISVLVVTLWVWFVMLFTDPRQRLESPDWHYGGTCFVAAALQAELRPSLKAVPSPSPAGTQSAASTPPGPGSSDEEKAPLLKPGRGAQLRAGARDVASAHLD